MKLTKEMFSSEITVIRDDGCGVRVDIIIDPDYNDGMPYYCILNFNSNIYIRRIYCYTLNEAVKEYNRMVNV